LGRKKRKSHDKCGKKVTETPIGGKEGSIIPGKKD